MSGEKKFYLANLPAKTDLRPGTEHLNQRHVDRRVADYHPRAGHFSSGKVFGQRFF
jgi:hypothetical protein